ncbi:MAG: aldehyde ferredoxin oxidoreductase family protein [Deltaproteobacteria bacterium]|nr:aldehyde ferredoxin oxidoreductase family protein [Deltaproteobacteria bacterium]
MYGLVGAALEVDLTKGEIRALEIPEAEWRRFLGGAGLAARMFFLSEDPGVDPLGPDNPLYLMTGPLAGSGVQGSSRFALCARSPLTGVWGESSCGGHFAPELKAAGFDAIVFRGASERPVYLLVEDGKAELADASDLWGLDTYQTVDAIGERMGEGRTPRVLCIGQAGENGVRFASACSDKHDFAGRCGMGAVMGAKRLKAVICRGTRKLELADPDGLKALRKHLTGRIRDSVPAASLHEMGTNSTMDLSMVTGDVPIKNYRVGEALEISAAIGGPTMTERFHVKAGACASCPIACKRVMKNDEEPWKMEQGPGPEYETVAAFGSMCENADAGSLLIINEWCNRYGLDTITCGCTVAFAIDCAEQGLLGPDELGGLDLGWGKAEAIAELVHRIARREGLGDLLADGSRAAARKIGKGAEALTAEIKGLEMPMHDPRGSHGLGLAYMMSNRGACHNAHLMHPVEQGMTTWEELGFAADYTGQSDDGKAEVVKLAEDFGVQCNSLCLCVFDMWTFESGDPLEALRCTCGWELSMDDYLRVGARTWLQKRALDNLMGVGVADDRLPAKVLIPLEDGAAAGSVPDGERLRREYYAARGLDERGWPLRAALEKVDLADVADRLEAFRPA